MLFIDNESIKFNDGNDTNDSAIYMGPVSHGDNLKHKIRISDNKEYLVDRYQIASITVPEISNVPISIEEYASKLHNLTPLQLEYVANLQPSQKKDTNPCILLSIMRHRCSMVIYYVTDSTFP